MLVVASPDQPLDTAPTSGEIYEPGHGTVVHVSSGDGSQGFPDTFPQKGHVVHYTLFAFDDNHNYATGRGQRLPG